MLPFPQTAARSQPESSLSGYRDQLNRVALGPTDDEAGRRFHRIVRQYLGAASTFEVVFTTDGVPTIERAWSQSRLDEHTEYRDRILQAAVTARQARALQVLSPDGYKLTTLLAPVICRNEVRRIWVAVIPKAEQQCLTSACDFETAADYYGLWHERRQGAESDKQLTMMARVIDLTAAVQHSRHICDSARALAAEIAALPGVHQVGVAVPKGHQLQLTAVSGLSDFDRRGTAALLLQAACRELQFHPCGHAAWPPAENAAAHSLLAHERLAIRSGAQYAATQQLTTRNGEVAAVVVWTGDLPAGQTASAAASDPGHQRLLMAACVPVAEAMSATAAMQRGRLHAAAVAALKYSQRKSGFLFALLLLLLIGAMFLPVPYRVRCTGRAEPVFRRFAVAPYEGIIERGFIRAGDIVTQGQLLARMDRRELHWELSGVIADEQRTRQERDVFLTDEEIPQAIMARLESERYSSQRQLLQNREDKLNIESPINGIVLSGDLERNENAPVRTGQSLYEIAPISPLKIQLFVSAEDITHVKIGHAAQVWFEGFSEPVAADVVRILPQSQEFEGRNVFVAEVEFVNRNAAIRPGMRGTAGITCEKHPLGWNIFHKPYEYLVSQMSW